jgi:hypothetical protein
MKSVAEEIADLRALGVPELVERYIELHGRLPHCEQPTWLFRKCAWRLQEIRLGGLSETARARLEQLIAEIDLDLGAERKQIKPARNGATLGTTVARIWKGREIRATSVEGGWEHEGVVYRSLSAIATAVTGSHWNGKLFFGLTRRTR